MPMNVVKEMINHNCLDISGCSVQDSTGNSIVSYLDLEEKACDILDTDKIGQMAIWDFL